VIESEYLFRISQYTANWTILFGSGKAPHLKAIYVPDEPFWCNTLRVCLTGKQEERSPMLSKYGTGCSLDKIIFHNISNG